MIHVVRGDLLQSDCTVIAHQVNCRGVMGAGLARQIKERYPNVFRAYSSACDSNVDALLGRCQFVKARKDLVVANLFGQMNYGKGKHTDYDALTKALISLRMWYKDAFYLTDTTFPFTDGPKPAKLGLPYGIGCGLAGGNWAIVYNIIEEVFEGMNVYLYKKGA